MAGRIAGITIEIGGDTTNLQKSLKGVDSQLKTTQGNLKDINKLLKLDPKNTELLTQKQKALKDAVGLAKDRLQQLKAAQSGVAEGSAEWDALQREIIATEQDLKKAETELKQFGSVSAQQLKAAGESMKQFGSKVEDIGKKLSVVSGAAAGALTGLGKLGYDAITSADDLNTLAKQTGVSTAELQKWSYASDLVDVSVDSMTGALKKLKKGMDGDAKALTALGVQTKNTDGSFRDTTEVFYDTLEALSKIEDGTERDLKAMEIFGKGADELAGIIDDGGASLKEYGAQAEELGVILDQDTLDALNETNDTIDKLKANVTTSLAKAGATLAQTFGPALEKVAGVIEKVAEGIRNLTPEQAEMIVKVLAVVAAIGPLVVIIGKVISGIGSLMTIIPLLAGPVGIVIAAVAAAIAIGVLIVKNWDKIKAAAKVVGQAVVKAWTALKTGVQNATNAVTTFVTNKWNTIKSKVTTVSNSIKSTVTNTWNNIKSKVTSVLTSIASTTSTKLNAIKAKYVENGGGIKGTVSATVEAVKQYWSAGYDYINSITGGKLDKLKSKVSSVFDSIKTLVSNAVTALKNAFNFTWSLPHIKVPHFRVSGGVWPYGLGGEGSLPSISIDWYKKAYDNPVMFTSPTVMATPNGYKGFGDGNGAEIVMGLDKLREVVGAGQNVTFNVVLQGDARQLFKVVRQQNDVRTKATNYNALAVGG